MRFYAAVYSAALFHNPIQINAVLSFRSLHFYYTICNTFYQLFFFTTLILCESYAEKND